jgi:hypothetical protein
MSSPAAATRPQVRISARFHAAAHAFGDQAALVEVLPRIPAAMEAYSPHDVPVMVPPVRVAWMRRLPGLGLDIIYELRAGDIWLLGLRPHGSPARCP